MNVIEFERWEPSADDPRKLEYAGQRPAAEVFEELKHRLESRGCLPDEYFLLDSFWENGREIPKDADIFCTTDYGASEGVYLDAYLKWFDKGQEKHVTQKFLTGKTLGENGSDLDRMFLVSSAITKAFHGDNATHARYMKIGGVEEDADGSVVYLSQQEKKVIIEALVEQRERQEQAMGQTEQLLRRMTGSITEYVNTVGMRPLRMSDFDKAVLAIQDGELEAFKKYAAKVPYQQEETLLVEAAGRPGAVGRKMTELLMQDRCNIDYAAYCNACKRAININDPEKVIFLMVRAQASVLHGSFGLTLQEIRDHRYLSDLELENTCQVPRQMLEGAMPVRDILALDDLPEGASLAHKNSVFLVPLEDLKLLTDAGKEDFAALLDARVADIWVDEETPELLLEGVEAAELDRLHDKLEAHKQAEQAMGPAMG